jgi:hypothetical protein
MCVLYVLFVLKQKRKKNLKAKNKRKDFFSAAKN